MLVACLAICAVLGTVAYQWRYRNPDWGQDEITNVVLLLVTTSAAVIALVAQREGGDVAARFVSGARVLGTVATVLPIAVAVFLVYGNSGTHPAERFFVLFLCLASAVPAGVIGKAWWNSVKADRHKAEKASPWDMADHEKARRQRQDETPKVRNFHDNVRHYGFDTAAIGVRSAEAWHEYYGWDDGAQLHAVTSLQPHVWPVPRPACAGSQSNCARRKACPRLITDGH
jgi:hypothetical protein